ncbi:MAG: TatD family hydrolase [Bifidobacteriaceae bacterium]|jgi:TatD DNase family protein|nr:TatD family hydrolase [Bifidobacteriaceae bacterium]
MAKKLPAGFAPLYFDLEEKYTKKIPNLESISDANQTGFIDTHTHLDMILSDIESITGSVISIEDILENCKQTNMKYLFHNACDLESILNISNVLDDCSNVDNIQVFGGVAIHPNETVLHNNANNESELEVAPDGLEPPEFRDIHYDYDLGQAISKVEEIAKNDKRIKIIGETGLDYFRTGPSGVDIQKNSFREHIRLAKELNLTLQIHDREAHQDVIDILLSDISPERVVFHSFSADNTFAQICAENGWFMSFSGPVTYNKNTELREALCGIPKELILTETDAPFLTPEPIRGTINTPSNVPITALYMASYLNMSISDFSQQIIKNMTNAFDI